VQVIENVGGTNERFAEELKDRGFLDQALLRISPSNEGTYSCFERHPHIELVMFTDLIEAQYRVSMPGSILSDEGFNFAIPGGLQTMTGKAYMAPRTDGGRALVQEVDAFFVAAANSGAMDEWKRAAFRASYPVAQVPCPIEFTWPASR